MDILEKTVQELQSQGGQIMALPCDVTQRSQIEQAVNAISRKWGTIDILVNNAGISGRTPIDDPDDARWINILQVNLTGTYLCTKIALPHMGKDGYGRIVNLSSVLGRFGVPGYSAYCTAKHGILGLTKALALELVDKGVTVNAICPTWVDTAMARQGMQETADVLGISLEQFHSQAMAAVPLKRMASVEEVASLVLYLCSPLASSITGQAINVCGGVTAGSGG